MTRYFRPESLSDALTFRAQSLAAQQPLTVLAGGTDVYPVRTHAAAWFNTMPQDVLDLSGVAELQRIDHGADGTTLGALATWSAVAATDLPPAFDALKQASVQVGGVQIQNRGTLGGNLCNASPAADGVPPLLALDAQIELASLRGVRRLPLAAFVLGNRKTALAPDELLVRIHIPQQPATARAAFLKLGARAYLVISIASVAANVSLNADGAIASASIAVGACSAAPLRLPALEARLVGMTASQALAQTVTTADLAGLSPIDDVRASAAYRRNAALILVRRALAQLCTPVLEIAA